MKMLLISNETLADALLQSMKGFFSEPDIQTFTFQAPDWQSTRYSIAAFLAEAVLKNPQEEFLILCDHFGSTAYVETAILIEKMALQPQSLLLCGMNLPMVFKLYGIKDTTSLAYCRSLYDDDTRYTHLLETFPEPLKKAI